MKKGQQNPVDTIPGELKHLQDHQLSFAFNVVITEDDMSPLRSCWTVSVVGFGLLHRSYFTFHNHFPLKTFWRGSNPVYSLGGPVLCLLLFSGFIFCVCVINAGALISRVLLAIFVVNPFIPQVLSWFSALSYTTAFPPLPQFPDVPPFILGPLLYFVPPVPSASRLLSSAVVSSDSWFFSPTAVSSVSSILRIIRSYRLQITVYCLLSTPIGQSSTFSSENHLSMHSKIEHINRSGVYHIPIYEY